MKKVNTGRKLYLVQALGGFILAGLFAFTMTVFLFIKGYFGEENVAIYNSCQIAFAICFGVFLVSGIVASFARGHANKTMVIVSIVVGFPLVAVPMIVGGFMLLSSLEELKKSNLKPSIDDEFKEGDDQLIVLASEEKKKYKSSKWQAYVNMWRKKSVGERVTLIIMLVIFIIYGFSLLFPLIWAFYNSFKTTQDFNADSFRLPLEWTFKNYEEMFATATSGRTNFVWAIFNSIWMSILSTFLGLFASCLTSYVVAKYRFKTSTLIYTVAIFIQIIPLVGGITGMYQLIWGTLKIGDNPFLIWPIWFGGFGFSFLMLYSAFKSVPWSYAESAFIDGAGHFTAFIRIMLPTVKPILASLFVVNFIGAWNDYMTAYLYMPSWAPLSLAVYLLRDDATRISYPVYLAVVIISVIPIIILFVSFQKLIMENTTVGGLKG